MNPYINTELYTIISLRADQLDNNIYINLKKNLEKKLLNKCYKDYGHISDIYKIDKYEEGTIEAENFAGSATFNITFTCKLCRPLRKKLIICQLKKVTKIILNAENGPINIIITSDRINNNKFFIDNNNIIRYIINNNKSNLLKSGDFVKIEVLSISLTHGDSHIKCIGFLNDMASDDEIQQFYDNQHKKFNNDLTNYGEYIQQDNVTVLRND